MEKKTRDFFGKWILPALPRSSQTARQLGIILNSSKEIALGPRLEVVGDNARKVGTGEGYTGNTIFTGDALNESLTFLKIIGEGGKKTVEFRTARDGKTKLGNVFQIFRMKPNVLYFNRNIRVRRAWKIAIMRVEKNGELDKYVIFLNKRN